MGKRIASIDDLTPDSKNANRGTERGRGLLERSLRQYGAGRSVLADKHGTLIAGNKTVDVAMEIGLPIRVVETDGTELVVVQRSDLDLGTDKAARELAYADNRIGQLSLEWELAQIGADVDAGLDLAAVGFSEAELAVLLSDEAAKQRAEDHRAADTMGTLKAVDGYDFVIDAPKLGYRLEAVAHCAQRLRALELFAGLGLLTYWYGRLFDEVLRVDASPDGQPDIVAKAERWLADSFDPAEPFDFVDFDDEGCPSRAIQAFFARIADRQWPPFVLCLTDGAGLNLKVRGRTNLQRDYRWGDQGVRVSSTELYEAHPALIEYHLLTVAAAAGYHARRISLYRGSRGHVTYGCYAITVGGNPTAVDSNGAGASAA